MLTMFLMSATAFAAEEAESSESSNEPYIYTSEDFQYTIACPIKPVAVVQNPWQEPEKRGEMLVFANEGWNILYAYVIQVNAFDTNKVPDFNSKDRLTIDKYLKDLRETNGFELTELVNISKTNKGVYAVTAAVIEELDENGEVAGELVADRQDIYTFFRTAAGRCVGIQLISVELNKEFVDTYRYGVATFKDNSADKKSDKKSKTAKKEKKSKKDKK